MNRGFSAVSKIIPNVLASCPPPVLRLFCWTKFWGGSKVRNMNPRVSNQKKAAMTLVEVLVVIILLAVIAAIFLPALNRKKENNLRKYFNCENNLKRIGLSFRIWAGDNGDKFPMQVSTANGGTMELVETGNAMASFLVLSNDLATPKVLVCPVDSSQDYTTNFRSDYFNGCKTSYFVGMDVTNEDYPQRILTGDDNFEIGGIPVKSGLLALSTNVNVAWTSSRHFIDATHFWTRTRHVFAGNICFADGSVQTPGNTGKTNLYSTFQQTGLATNRLAIP